MFQDGLDDLPVFDEAEDPHDSPTLRASQGIDLVDLLDQPGPVLPVFLRTLIRFQDAGDPVVFGFFSLSPGDITVVSIIPQGFKGTFFPRPVLLFPLSAGWSLYPGRNENV